MGKREKELNEMEIQRVNGLLVKAIATLQADEIEVIAEAMAGGYRVPPPSKLGFKAKPTVVKPAKVAAKSHPVGFIGQGNDKRFVTPTARLTWNKHSWNLVELPQKGKKRLRVSDMQNADGMFRGRMDSPNHFIDENILQKARLAKSDSFDQIKSKLTKAFQAAISDLKKNRPDWWKQNSWVERIKWYDNSIHYLKVVPEGTDPITAKGKDFTVHSEWTKFSAYDPGADFQDHDPHYTQYASKSAAAGRKLYKILKADPKALSNISWNEFRGWLGKKKIAIDTHFSQWH